MEEFWKDIPEYEGLYQISNFGNIKSVGTKSNHIYDKILTPLVMTNYYGVKLSKNGIKKNKKIHRLVAKTFIPNPENKPQVNHINGVKTDNRVENLEWCTASENQLHAIKMGFIKKTRNKKSIKKIIQTNLSGEIVRIWDNNKQIIENTNYKKENITSCCNKRNKTAYGYIWKYVKE